MNTSAWIEALGWTLIHFVWQGTLVAACLSVVCLAARTARPQLRYLAGCLALLATVAFAAVTFAREIKTARQVQDFRPSAVSETSDPQFASAVSADQQTVLLAAPTPSQFAGAQSLDSEPPAALISRSPAKLRDRFAQALQPYTSTIVAVWILGVSLFSARLWRSWRAVRQLRSSGTASEKPVLEKSFMALRAALGASRAAQFLVSARVRVPMVIGWLKPLILLPASVLAGLSTVQLEAILAHELAHIRRQDYLVNLLQNAIETIFFYHPAVWWISRRIREEREHCCDDIAAAATGGALGYVDALAALEETRATAPDLVLAINGGSLLGRARRLLIQTPEEGPARGLFAGGLVLLLMAAIFVIPFTLSRAADPAAAGETNPKVAQVGGTSGANEHLRAFDEVKRRGFWPAELLQQLPFGSRHQTGLRAAWIFRPMREEYFIGDSLASRIIIHNDGNDPVEFFAQRWIQDAEWSIVDANGTRVTPKLRRSIRSDIPAEEAEQRVRLAPGETAELSTPAVGIGPGDFDEVYGDDFLGVYLPARAGDEYRCKWSISFRGAWALTGEATAAIPAPVKLETGEVKFRVVARNPAGPKPVSIATAPGRYILEPGLDLRILRMNFQPTVVVNGVPREPLPAREQNLASVDPKPAVIPPGGRITRKMSGFRLPDGDGTYVIAWQRGERTLWIGEADSVRKVDLTVAGRFPLKEVLDTVEPLERERLGELADQFSSGISFPEKQWKWEDSTGFASTPPEIKAALEQHRPKRVDPAARASAFEPPVDGAKIYADAEKLASSYRPPERGEAESAKTAQGLLSLAVPSGTTVRVGSGEIRAPQFPQPGPPSAEPQHEKASEGPKPSRGENKDAAAAPAEAAVGKPADTIPRSAEVRPNGPDAEAPAQAPADPARQKQSQAALEQQRALVDKTRNELAALNQLKPEDAVEAFSTLKNGDKTKRNTLSLLQEALAEEAKLVAAGLGDSHIQLKALRAEIAHFRKLLADEFESVKRAHRTKLQIEETQLKTMKERLAAPKKSPEAKDDQTPEVLKRSRGENKDAASVPAVAAVGKPADTGAGSAKIRPNGPDAEAPAQVERQKPSSEALAKQRALVDRTRNELIAIDRIKPEELADALRALEVDDPTMWNSVRSYLKAAAEEGKLLGAGLGDTHPQVKSLRAQIVAHRKTLSEHLDAIKRVQRTKLTIVETHLMSMEESFAANAPNAGATAQPSAEKNEPKQLPTDLVQQRARVEKTRNELNAIAQLKPDELMKALHVLKIEDETVRQLVPLLQNALAEEAKLLGAGLGGAHPQVKSLRGQIAAYRAMLADQLDSIQRAQRTKLEIEETHLKNMENRGAPQKKSDEAKHEQTRDVLKLWRAEFERKPYFAFAINQKLQRKDNPSKPAVPTASDDQPDRDVTFLDKTLSAESERSKSLPATLPAEAMRRVAKQVRKFIEASPGPPAEKFQSLLPRLEAEREWPWAEAVTLLDELCDIATGPVGWLELEEQFRAFNRAKKGHTWDADALKALPFGPPNEQGLRAAWIFDPMQPAYAVGDVLKSRILIHNTGTQSIEFRTDAWHQEDRWNVIDASGKPVKVKTTWYTGITPLQRFRLDPGQVVEVAGHGAGIGAADYSEKYSVGAIGAEIPAQPGDELRCTWDVKVKLGSDSDPNAAELKPLRTGEVKFRVVPADPNAPKPPGLATAPGRYDLAPSIKLQVSQVTSGKDGEPTNRVNTASILWFDANNVQTQSHEIELPPGLGSYAIVWARGTTTLWIGKHDTVQKVDFAEPTKVRVQAWPWDQGGDFGGIPEILRATLEKRRPKASAAATDIPAGPAAAESPKPSWKVAGRVTDKDGNPMPDVEIWVHTGQGSLHRTGLGKTNADGRYEVEFGLAVMMEKESAQLQFANVTAHKPGWFEKNLNRQGSGAAAMREVSADDLKGYGARTDQLALPGKTREVNFIMDRAVTIKGRLLGTGSFPRLPPQDYRGKDEKLIAGYIRYDRAPLTRWKVWLTGPELAPATGVFASAETDQEGRFEFKDVPVGFDWQIEIDTHRRGAAARTPLFKPRSTDESATDLEYIIEENAVKFLVPARKGAGPVVPQNNQGNIQFIEGESGRPIPNAALSVLFLSADPVTPPPTQMTADAEGVARIEVRRSRTAILAPNVPDRWSSNSIVLGEGAQNGGALTPPSRPGGPMQIALWKGTKVTGRLLLPDGSPLRGAPLSVEAYVANEEWKKRLVPDRGDSVNWSKLTKTREDGTFAITVPPAEARNSLRVFSPEIAFGVTAPPETKAALAKCAPFHVADGGPEGKSTERQGVLDFGERKLLSGIVVRGRVEDSGGKPMPGIGLSLLYNPRTGISRVTRSDADGRFAFPPLPPGEVTIHAHPRLLVEGQLPNPPAEAVFVRQALTLREGTASVDVVARAVPVIALEFEWIDRRTKKGGPMSAFGSFPVSGSVRDSKGELRPWRGYLEKTKRDGKEFLFAKIPAQIIDPALQLFADSWVTARYEDDSTTSGPGTFAIRNHATPKRRIIYGDDPQPGR